jgi:phytoene desaturase
MKIVVLGAGIGGLSVACRLSSLGHDVTLLEKNKTPGGKASVVKLNGYTFDAGPSLFTYPDWLDDVFISCNKNPRDYYTYKKLELVTRYFFQDKSYFDVFDDLNKTAQSVESSTDYSSCKFIKQLNHWEMVYQLSEKTFLSGKIKLNFSFLNAALRWFLKIGIRSIFSSMADFNKRNINNEKVELLFNRFATYTGSSPFKTPAFMNQLSVVELCKGAYYPDNGIYSIPKALEKLAFDMGVKIQYNQEVSAIVKEMDSWLIKASSTCFSSELVISNIDYCYTRKLMGKQYELATNKLSTSGVVFYWGISTKIDVLKLHNVFFSEDYQKEFSQIVDDAIFPEKPTVYVNVSSKIDSHHAKDGCENWFVMVNVPSDLELTSKESINKLRAAVIDLLNNKLNVNVEQLIECEKILTPNSLNDDTGAYKGSIYGLNQNSLFKIMTRKENKDKFDKGLYYVGGTVHPGGGIPLALLSAKNTVTQIIKDY